MNTLLTIGGYVLLAIQILLIALVIWGIAHMNDDMEGY